MTMNKRKKNSRQRGSHTHGWGAKKKHRGKGNRGGSGRASSGKRSDARKPATWKEHDYFGKHGFSKKGAKEKIKAVNISYIDENMEKLVREGKAKEEKGVYSVKLMDLGFNKLLGSGKTGRKIIVETKYASKPAEERVKEAGGEVRKEKVAEQ